MPKVSRGKHLEALLRKTGETLSNFQIARIHQWPTRQIAQRAPVVCPHCGNESSGWTALFVEKTGYDFFGFTSRGRYIAIEAKEGVRDRLPVFVQKGHGVKMHQMLALAEVHRTGGIAMVVWKKEDRIAVIPASLIDEDAKSIRWTDVHAYEQKWSNEHGIPGLLKSWPSNTLGT